MLKAAFEELTVERGETINILGMTVYMDREHGKAVINQQHFLDKVCSTYGITRAAVTPATGDLMYKRTERGLLGDQSKIISLHSTLMYASKHTYPEISFPVTYLSSRYNRATEDDYAKALKVAEYTHGCGDNITAS